VDADPTAWDPPDTDLRPTSVDSSTDTEEKPL
jgi:hypothetical protein